MKKLLLSLMILIAIFLISCGTELENDVTDGNSGGECFEYNACNSGLVCEDNTKFARYFLCHFYQKHICDTPNVTDTISYCQYKNPTFIPLDLTSFELSNYSLFESCDGLTSNSNCSCNTNK